MDIKIILSVIIIVNLLFMLVKTADKYWKYPILLWITILITLLLMLSIQQKQLKDLKEDYWASAEGRNYGDWNIWNIWQDKQKEWGATNRTLYYFFGFQTTATFILQFIGFQITEKKRLYTWTTIIFMLLTTICLSFLFLLEIVPTKVL